MKALVVGAGAVGQVFGYHLARGGAEVVYFVKDKYIDELKRGMTLYPLRDGASVRFDDYDLTTDPIACDQVYLTVSSTALRGAWLDELVRATGDATIVKLQPSLDDRAYLAERAAPARIVDGTINFLSYHAPLPGETRFAEPGMAYWLFPGKAPFSGDDAARVAAVVEALAAGELPAKRVASVPRSSAFPAALLGAFIAALEAAGWSFQRMRDDGLASLGARAAADALRVVGHELGAAVPLPLRLAAKPLAFRAITRVGPHVVPLDLETYLRVHFTKVSDQMHASLRLYLDRARAAALDVPALAELAGLVAT